jgi:hypothetical protein
MSRYDWQAGSIKLPSGEWAKFKKNMFDFHNQNLEKDLVLLNELYLAVKAEIKGKRNVKLFDVINEELRKEIATRSHRAIYQGQTVLKYDFLVLVGTYDPTNYLIKKDESGTQKLIAPKKSSLPWANSKTEEILIEYHGAIQLDNATKTVKWNIEEGNRAVEDTRNAPMGKWFINAMEKMVWSRGTGGYFTGNDEYNQESANAGGAANYLCDTFGPLGKQADIERHHRNGFSMAQAKAMVG